MKPEVKQSRQQRANKDSRSAKQRYGKERNRDDYEDDMFQNKNARKKKDQTVRVHLSSRSRL